MKRNIGLIIVTLLLATISNCAYSQYTINNTSDAKSRMYNQQIVIPQYSDFKVETDGWLKEQKRLRRKERNFFETKTSILFNQYSFVNWSGGGVNSVNGKFTTLNTHSYTHNKIAIDSYINAAIGFNIKSKDIWKTDDYIELNTVANYQLWGKWTYALGINLKTQFAKGYSGDNEEYTSTFFAPATLKPFVGISFRNSDTQIITFAPLSGNILFVLDERLSNEGSNGITPGKKTKSSIGSYINVQWEQPIDKNGILKYKTNFQVFCDYTHAPTLGWENWLNITVLKYLTVGLYLHVIYNDQIAKQDGASTFWQLNQSLGIGVAYNFKNKDSKPSGVDSKLKFRL